MSAIGSRPWQHERNLISPGPQEEPEGRVAFFRREEAVPEVDWDYPEKTYCFAGPMVRIRLRSGSESMQTCSASVCYFCVV